MKRIGSFFAGLLLGTMLFGGTTAYAAGVIADLSNHQFFVDGKEVKMTAYVPQQDRRMRQVLWQKPCDR